MYVQRAGPCNDLDTRRGASVAKPKDYRGATDYISPFELLSPGEGGVGAWYVIRLGRPPRIALYRMTCSCSTPNVSGYHVNTTVPKLIADLHLGLPIEVLVELIATASVDGRGMICNLLIAFARIGRP